MKRSMDLSAFSGGRGIVRGYIAEHKLLIIHLEASSKTTQDTHLLCNWCRFVPQIWSWEINEIEVFELDDHRFLVSDWKKNVFVPCGSVQIQNEFDLRRWMGSGD